MKNIFVTHNSCLNASYDLNIVKEGLVRQGYILVNDPTEADEIIFAGCGAHSTWVHDAISQITQLAELSKNKRLVVTGCISNIEATRLQSSVDHKNVVFQSYDDILATYTDFDFQKLDNNYLQNEILDYEGKTKYNQLRQRLNPEKLRLIAKLKGIDHKYGTNLASLYRRTTKGFLFYHEEEPTVFITVSRGCPYHCSYCAIPKGRGRYTSVPQHQIINKVREALSCGTRKVMLIGDEVGNYGMDLGSGGILDLLKSILALDEHIKIGIRYIEPNPFLKNYSELEKLCIKGQIHLLYVPIQSGSAQVLSKMNRKYDLEELSNKLKNLIMSTNTITYSNWMVGFPTETECDYQKTVELARKINFHVNTAIPFSERPGTAALKLPGKVSDDVVTSRLKRLRKLFVELKVARFQNATTFLEESKRKMILQSIEEAEKVTIKETPNSIPQ